MQSVNLNNSLKLTGLTAGRPAAPSAPVAPAAAPATTARDLRVGTVAPTAQPGTAADPILAAELRLATCYHADADVFAANLAAVSLQDLVQNLG